MVSGGRSETFAGLAGAGDLVATAIAGGQPQPARRRAGRLRHAEASTRRRWQTAESLATVPLLNEAFAREGIDAPITTGLREVLDGEASPEQWLESVRSAGRSGGPAPPDSAGCGDWAARWVNDIADKQRLDRDFTELYQAHLRDVYSYAYYRIGNHHDAEDLTEQTL